MKSKLKNILSILILALLVLPGDFSSYRPAQASPGSQANQEIAKTSLVVVSVATHQASVSVVRQSVVQETSGSDCKTFADINSNPVQNTVSTNLFSLPAACFSITPGSTVALGELKVATLSKTFPSLKVLVLPSAIKAFSFNPGQKEASPAVPSATVLFILPFLMLSVLLTDKIKKNIKKQIFTYATSFRALHIMRC